VGLSTAQLFVLQKLAEAGELSVNEVAERTHTHQSSVSVVVQRLVERGLVSRERSRHDARQMQLSATRAGHAILRSAPSPAQDRLIGAMARMTPPHLRQLATSLQRLVDLLGVDKDEPAVMLFEDETDSPGRPAPAPRLPEAPIERLKRMADHEIDVQRAATTEGLPVAVSMGRPSRLRRSRGNHRW